MGLCERERESHFAPYCFIRQTQQPVFQKSLSWLLPYSESIWYADASFANHGRTDLRILNAKLAWHYWEKTLHATFIRNMSQAKTVSELLIQPFSGHVLWVLCGHQEKNLGFFWRQAAKELALQCQVSKWRSLLYTHMCPCVDVLSFDSPPVTRWYHLMLQSICISLSALSCRGPFYKIMVPTVDTVRYNFLVKALVLGQCPVLLTGPLGTGKTSMAQSVLHELDSSWAALTVNVSSQVGGFACPVFVCAWSLFFFFYPYWNKFANWPSCIWFGTSNSLYPKLAAVDGDILQVHVLEQCYK